MVASKSYPESWLRDINVRTRHRGLRIMACEDRDAPRSRGVMCHALQHKAGSALTSSVHKGKTYSLGGFPVHFRRRRPPVQSQHLQKFPNSLSLPTAVGNESIFVPGQMQSFHARKRLFKASS
jgi:hypothetical protein